MIRNHTIFEIIVFAMLGITMWISLVTFSAFISDNKENPGCSTNMASSINSANYCSEQLHE